MKYAKIRDTPFNQRSLIHREAWFPPCFVRQNQPKKLFFFFWDFRPLPNKNVILWDHFFPLLFPKDSESLKILDIRLWEVVAKRRLNGTSKVNWRTDRKTDISTYRKHWPRGPMLWKGLAGSKAQLSILTKSLLEKNCTKNCLQKFVFKHQYFLGYLLVIRSFVLASSWNLENRKFASQILDSCHEPPSIASLLVQNTEPGSKARLTLVECFPTERRGCGAPPEWEVELPLPILWYPSHKS